ncbi:MAG: hypothetical protein WAN65_04065 [Candidatus Sulfotelmatobacter sp.]
MADFTHSVAVALSGQALDAEESVVEFDDGVVAVAVSPGDEDGETEVRGTGEEGGFGGFSATLAGGLGGGVEGDGFGFEGLLHGEWLDQDWREVALRIVEVLLHKGEVGQYYVA